MTNYMPPPPAYPPPPAMGYPGQPGMPPMGRRGNGWAVASLVCGIVFCVPGLTSLLAAMLPSPLRSNPANPSAYLRQRQRWILRQL